MSEATATAAAPKNIFEALVQVRAACPYVQKDKQMQGRATFNYASIDAYLLQLKPELDKAGICIFPVKSELISKERIEVGDKKTLMYMAVVRVQYMVTHAASGTSLPQPVEVMGEATDNLDKSIPKAFTMALKQCMRQLFQVETGEDEQRPMMPTHAESPMVPKMVKTIESCEDYPSLNKVWDLAKESNLSEGDLATVKKAADAAADRIKQKRGGNPRGQGNGHRQAQDTTF